MGTMTIEFTTAALKDVFQKVVVTRVEQLLPGVVPISAKIARLLLYARLASFVRIAIELANKPKTNF